MPEIVSFKNLLRNREKRENAGRSGKLREGKNRYYVLIVSTAETDIVPRAWCDRRAFVDHPPRAGYCPCIPARENGGPMEREDYWRVAWLISRSFLIPNEMTEFAEP